MWLLAIALAFILHNSKSAVGVTCVPNELQHTASISPSLTISVVEFPGENVLPVGYNVTILCRSNASAKSYGFGRYFGQPFWIQFYFNRDVRSIKECGGRDGDVDSEDSKVCTLPIQRATRNDSGNYTCWTYNQVTCTEGTLKLDFIEPFQPVFTVEPPDAINVTAGSKLNMSCKASGVPSPVVKWYKDGLPVSEEKTAKIMGMLFLTIEYVTSTYQGKYWCEARNLKGWKRSSSTTLALKQEPGLVLWDQLPLFYRHPKSITAAPGDDVVFTCAAKGSPAPTIIWFKDRMIKAHGKATYFQGKDSAYSVLAIFTVRDKNHGYYSCQATNAVGSRISKEAALYITGETSSTSNSAGVSNVVWISISAAAVSLVALLILILLIHKKWRKADLEANMEMNARQLFPHLHLQGNSIFQQLRNSNAYVDATQI